jgi:hypothetical protein
MAIGQDGNMEIQLMDEVDLNVSEIVLRFVEGREKKGHQKRR